LKLTPRVQENKKNKQKCCFGIPVTSYIIKGGGYTWPGGKQYLPIKMVGVTSLEIDAS
jgi:polyhydroxybutyrate depolymerase